MARGFDGNTPLHYCVRLPAESIVNHLNLVAQLIFRSDVNAVNQSGESPLFQACLKGKNKRKN